MRYVFGLLLCSVLVAGCGGFSGHGGDSNVTPGVSVISLPTSDIVYDQASQMIYASVPNTGGPHSNRVAAIDPISGSIVKSVFVGSNPSKLALSDNGQYLYVAIDAAVRRLDTVSLNSSLRFSLGNSDWGGPYFLQDMEVCSGAPETLAISRYCRSTSPGHQGVAIYDNGIQRPNTTPEHTGANVIEFSNREGMLYGLCTESSEFGFRQIEVNPEGATVVQVTRDLITGFYEDIEYCNGLIYATSGDVIDPETCTLVGRFPAHGPVEPDPLSRRVYFLAGDEYQSNWMLRSYDMETFVQVGSLSIPNLSGTPIGLVICNSKLAFNTSEGQLFLVDIESIR